ncbi:hypothetical protein [Clostridium sp. DJ247]|uniref:hypothetical protein n=1 Tax=Clostridium sp. DJ247 TaxID=2726188 RepID=UPI001627D4D7|nr:hypothetical protein [Clostridium sp. DJ247]MBC2580450.1 hypothetical protein [Clostridium sp. DJ247]
MYKNSRKRLILIFSIALTVVILTFYKINMKPSHNLSKSSPPILKYSVYFGLSTAPKYAVDNPNDFVTKYIENKFNIKVKEIVSPSFGASTKDRLNMFIAANDIPDVLVAGEDVADYAVSTGKFADLTEYIGDMKNLNKYFPQDMWYRYMNNGKKYQIPQIKITPLDSKYKDDPLNLPYMHALWVREDVLSKLGYKFTPLDDIAKQYMDIGKKAPLDAYNIDPAIDTPDKFLNFLRKVKSLSIEKGDTNSIPFSSTAWSTFHLGSMFDYSQWRIDPSGNVSGFLGTQEAKQWMHMLWTMYQEGLIDKSFLLQNDEQLQQKIASGQVKVGISIPDINGAVNSMHKINSNYKIRFIPLPKKNANLGFYDTFQPGFYRWLIRKDFPDIKRLTQYFDWFYSDEGIDLLTWGPESSDLWEIHEGNKVFKDPQIADSLINGTKAGKKGPETYGLWCPSVNSSELTFFTAKAAVCAPVMADFNPYDSRKSYPIKLDKYMANRQVAINGYDTKGIVSYGDGNINTSTTSIYFWNEFQSNGIAKILSAKNEAEFENSWNQQYDLFIKYGKYNEAKSDMEKWFAKYASYRHLN